MTKLTKQQLDDIRAALQDDKRGLLQSEQRQLLAHAEAVQASQQILSEVVALLERNQKWLNRLPVPTTGATHQMMHVVGKAINILGGMQAGRNQAGMLPVPIEPTEQQWAGLARDIMMGYDLGAKSPRALLKHLHFSGTTAPEWLQRELGDGTSEAVLSKGSRCVLIYKAMVHAIQQGDQ